MRLCGDTPGIAVGSLSQESDSSSTASGKLPNFILLMKSPKMEINCETTVSSRSQRSDLS